MQKGTGTYDSHKTPFAFIKKGSPPFFSLHAATAMLSNDDR
jgi:hypothetical protein